MKFMLLAATALLAGPAIAQDMAQPPATTTTAPTAPATTAQQPPAGQETMTVAEDVQTPGGDAAGAVSETVPTNAPQTTGSGTPAGGYQPAPGATPPAAGGPVRVEPSVSPSQAFPPPAPLASYPVCKKGQYDKCRQRGGK